MIDINMKKYLNKIIESNLVIYKGKVTRITGLTIESDGPIVSLGELCHIYPFDKGEPILSEVVGFKEDKILLMPLGEMEGLGPGSMVVALGETLKVNVGNSMIGRILDGLGNPIDDKGPINEFQKYPVTNLPPNPLKRKKVTEILPVGVKAIDGLLTCGKGQRFGLFAGSGVGKSTLMGMIARNSSADINVIALIGERGREVREFIEHELKEEGLNRSIVIVATSDQPALVRKKGALLATAIAEYFRDNGKNVMLFMDSLTRFAMAQREIGLAIGEPPITKGFTPSVFAVLPRLLERSGNSEDGSITALYTVLVDGDDLNEPITDTVRGIVDGHIVLSRKLANKNHYPAIDVLASISRVMPNICSVEHIEASSDFKDSLSTFIEAEDLINIGAYKQGSNKKIDRSISLIDNMNEFLKQNIVNTYEFEEILVNLKDVIK